MLNLNTYTVQQPITLGEKSLSRFIKSYYNPTTY
jgi:hypothetical protein